MFECPPITIIACESLLQKKERVEHILKVFRRLWASISPPGRPFRRLWASIPSGSAKAAIHKGLLIISSFLALTSLAVGLMKQNLLSIQAWFFNIYQIC